MAEEYRYTYGTATAGTESAPQPVPTLPESDIVDAAAEGIPGYTAVPGDADGQMVPEETAGGQNSGSIAPYYESFTPQPEKTRLDPDGNPVGERAGFWPRFFAVLIDTVVASVIWFALSVFVRAFITERLLEPFFFKIDLLTVLYYVSYKTYSIVSLWRSQKTLGKRALRIKLISSETFGKADLWTVFFRETFGKFISAICVVGNLMLLGKRHLPLYDRLADTEVVYDLGTMPAKTENAGAEPAQAVSGEADKDDGLINN